VKQEEEKQGGERMEGVDPRGREERKQEEE